MNEVRKRHSKLYAKMQLDLREAQLFRERKEGYKKSVQSDVERKIREKKEEEERLAKELAEKKHREAIERRRKQLMESLPDEPGRGVKDAFTIALRFPNGQSGRRRFTPDTRISVIFDWVDAAFNLERERAILTTMNGKQTFQWNNTDETTLSEEGFAKMVGFRVAERKEEASDPGLELEEKTEFGI